jgi:hypothetical protein
MSGTGKLLIVLGMVLLLAGIIFLLADKFPGVKSVPGDMVFKKKNFTFYFPLGTSILISIILTLILYLWRRYGG